MIKLGANGRQSCGAAILLAAVATPMQASAQDQIGDEYVSSVTARERERAEASPIQLGSFLISPQLNIEATYDDNIYATNTDARDDAYFTIRPELFVRSTWSVHALSAHAYYERDVYSKYSSEDANNFGVDIAGRLDVSRQTRIYAAGGIEQRRESRGSLSSFFNTLEPVQYKTYSGRLAVEQDLGNLKIRADGSIRRYRYDDAVLPTGVLDQSFRDSKIYGSTLQIGYDINGLTQVFVRGALEFRRYDLRPGDPGFDPITQTDRSGDSVRIEAGIEREITRLIRVTARVGYLNFRYPDPRLQDISAFSYFGNLRWNITPLTTINGTAQRVVDETSSQITAGNLRDEVGITVDHELLRTLILTARGRLSWINPSVVSGLGLINTRSSREQEFGLEARYYITQALRIQGGYIYSARQSSDNFISYKSNRVSIGVNYIF